MVMITKIAYRLEELRKNYGNNVENVSLNQQGNTINIKIRNQFGYANYTLKYDTIVEHIVKEVLETIQPDFIYSRSTDEVDYGSR